MARTDRVRLFGFDLVVEPGVFHPSLFFSSKILGKYLLSLDLNRKSVLDMGTGSGILALCAARAGGCLTAVDVLSNAIDCARMNVAQAGLLQKITCLQSDLFANVPATEGFDLIIWNPPFYDRAARGETERAWNAGEAFELIGRFAREAGAYLKPGGEIVMILSSDVDDLRFFESFARFVRTPILSRRRLFEKLTVYRLVPRR
jgi:release factor glutamine methyltransferase